MFKKKPAYRIIFECVQDSRLISDLRHNGYLDDSFQTSLSNVFYCLLSAKSVYDAIWVMKDFENKVADVPLESYIVQLEDLVNTLSNKFGNK